MEEIVVSMALATSLFLRPPNSVGIKLGTIAISGVGLQSCLAAVAHGRKCKKICKNVKEGTCVMMNVGRGGT